MTETEVVDRIRHIFLQPAACQHYAGGGALRVVAAADFRGIENGEVELWTTPLGKWFPRAEMIDKALEI